MSIILRLYVIKLQNLRQIEKPENKFLQVHQQGEMRKTISIRKKK